MADTVKHTTQRKATKRDPEGRKRSIINAAADLIAREGTKRITHRRVAEQANVPLGSTTHYFSSVDDLRRCGLAELQRRIDEDFDAMFEPVSRNEGSTDSFIRAFNDYLAREDEVGADAAFYAACIHDPEVRALARNVFDAMVKRSERYVGPVRAQLLAVLLDGLMIDTYLNGKPIDPSIVQTGVMAILAARDDPHLDMTTR